MSRFIRRMLIIFLIVYGAAFSAHALNNEKVFSQFQFNFLTPGARATALGGAFIGLADDATAIASNPAGLTTLTEPEISLELKHITYTTEQIYANRSVETPITRKEFDDVVESVPFVSLVYPYKRVTFSLYRQEVVNYKSSFRTGTFPVIVPGTTQMLKPYDAAVDLTVTNYGIGVAVEPVKGLSFAVSPGWAEMTMKSYSRSFGRHIRFTSDSTNFSEQDVDGLLQIDQSDVDLSVNAGVLWKIHPKIAIGAAYRKGPIFTVMESHLTRGEEGTAGMALPELSEFTLRVPDSFGAGIVLRATEFLTFSVDVVHILYEDLLEDFDIVESGMATKDNYTIENATEIHVGAEYVLPLGKRFLALRTGIYHEPDHTIRFTGTTGDPEYDSIYRELFPGAADQWHVTGGIGLVVNNRFQVDTAVNIAENAQQFSFSAVYRF